MTAVTQQCDDNLSIRGNVTVWLQRPDGRRVRVIKDHNVFTDVGRNWLAGLISYHTLSQVPGADEPATSKRRYDGVRYVGVGTGSQPETNAVQRIYTPVPYNVAGHYLAQIGAPNEMPGTGISAVFERIFGLNEISMPSTTYISEAGLFPSGPAHAPLDPAHPFHAPIAYTTFEPIPVSTALLFGVRWEIKI